MDLSTLHIAATITLFITFIGIVLWAYSGKRKSAFEAAARAPLDDDPLLASDGVTPNNARDRKDKGV